MRALFPLSLPLLGLALVALPAQGQPQPPPPSGPQVPAAQTVLPSLAPLIESVKAAVVNVDVQARSSGRMLGGRQGGNPFEDFFGMPFAPPDRERIQQGQGSGFIIDPRGLVLTNNHVVENAVDITVRLNDGRTAKGKVLGRDPLTDVALVKLEGNLSNLPTVKLGDSDALKVGDWVLAIGNPFGLASSVSLGILSGRGRDIQAGPYDDFLQTDAAINPGNSGGPLFNMRGEVVGINTAIVGGGAGIGFAVPSNLVKALLPQLEKSGSVTRGFLAVGIQDLTPELARALKVSATEGVVINNVTPGGPAAKAGLKPEDVVVTLDGEAVKTASQLSRTVALKRPGSTVTLGVLRKGKKQDVKVELGTRPDIEGVASATPPDEGTESRQARIGVALQDMDPRLAQAQEMSPRGALITNVAPASPAEEAGLVQGMLVVEADRKPVRSARDLQRIITQAKKGSTLLLRVEVPGGDTVLRALSVP